MTRTTRSITRISIAIILIIVGVGSGQTWLALVTTGWFISTIERDQRAVSREAIAKRIDKLREDKRRYPYKYRLHQGHSIKD